MTAYTKTVTTRTGVNQQGQPRTPVLASNLAVALAQQQGVPTAPARVAYFDRYPTGSMYLSTGLGAVLKWNGTRGSFVPVGLAAPAGTPVVAGAGSASLSGTYQIYVRFEDEDGQFSPLSPASAQVTVSSVANLTYSSLPTPTDPRVVKRQILRNTDSEFTTFYVDLETTDLWSTTLSSVSNDDNTLATQVAVPLVDSNGNSLTLQWSAPRDDKPILAHHRGRMFAAGEVAYRRGNVQVSFGGTQVTGVDTGWTTNLVGRELLVLGTQSPRTYTITVVDAGNQVLTLKDPYQGQTDRFASYAIRPPAAQRNTFYYSQASQPEQWPPINALTLEDAGDAVTALIPAASFIYVAFTDSIHRFTFDQDPSQDGSIYRLATRGCVNQRTWARVNETFFVLDKQGVYSLSGGEVQEIALPVRDLWSREALGDFKIDWTLAHQFHCSHDLEDTTLRFHVSLAGPNPPRHAVCYNYLYDSWWVEEYPFPVTSSAWQADQARVLLGGPGGKLFEQGVGTTDGPDPTGYGLSGTVQSSTLTTFTDPALRVPTAGVVGAPVALTGGTGKGQLRLIESVSSGTVKVQQPWLVMPDSTTTYQIGGISWRIKTGWYLQSAQADDQAVECFFSPSAGSMDVRLYQDYGTTPELNALDRPLAGGDSDGVSYAKGGTDVVVDLSRAGGYIRFRPTTLLDSYQRRGGLIAMEARGVAGPQGVFLHSISLGGAQ